MEQALLLREVRVALGVPVRNISAFGTGLAGPQYIIETVNQRFFLKTCLDKTLNVFEAEARGLQVLRDTRALYVPQIHALGSFDNVSFLILEYLDACSPNDQDWGQFGRGLAQLHMKSSEQFGFEEDNFIGQSVQRNSWRKKWSEFFFDQRLSVQLEIAVQSRWLDKAQHDEFRRCREQVLCLFESQEPPALVHGDLWSGNIVFSTRGPAVIDPAVYYGCREVDLAFTEMFARFPEAFYRAYARERPIPEHYEQRRDFLNLYHWLNHANMFGGSYRDRALAIFHKLIAWLPAGN